MMSEDDISAIGQEARDWLSAKETTQNLNFMCTRFAGALVALHSALSSALHLTYTPECSRDERWFEERERLNRVLGGEAE